MARVALRAIDANQAISSERAATTKAKPKTKQKSKQKPNRHSTRTQRRPSDASAQTQPMPAEPSLSSAASVTPAPPAQQEEEVEDGDDDDDDDDEVQEAEDGTVPTTRRDPRLESMRRKICAKWETNPELLHKLFGVTMCASERFLRALLSGPGDSVSWTDFVHEITTCAVTRRREHPSRAMRAHKWAPKDVIDATNRLGSLEHRLQGDRVQNREQDRQQAEAGQVQNQEDDQREDRGENRQDGGEHRQDRDELRQDRDELRQDRDDQRRGRDDRVRDGNPKDNDRNMRHLDLNPGDDVGDVDNDDVNNHDHNHDVNNDDDEDDGDEDDDDDNGNGNDNDNQGVSVIDESEYMRTQRGPSRTNDTVALIQPPRSRQITPHPAPAQTTSIQTAPTQIASAPLALHNPTRPDAPTLVARIADGSPLRHSPVSYTIESSPHQPSSLPSSTSKRPASPLYSANATHKRPRPGPLTTDGRVFYLNTPHKKILASYQQEELDAWGIEDPSNVGTPRPEAPPDPDASPAHALAHATPSQIVNMPSGPAAEYPVRESGPRPVALFSDLEFALSRDNVSRFVEERLSLIKQRRDCVDELQKKLDQAQTILRDEQGNMDKLTAETRDIADDWDKAKAQITNRALLASFKATYEKEVEEREVRTRDSSARLKRAETESSDYSMRIGTARHELTTLEASTKTLIATLRHCASTMEKGIDL